MKLTKKNLFLAILPECLVILLADLETAADVSVLEIEILLIFGILEERTRTNKGIRQRELVSIRLYHDCLLYTSPSPRDRG